MLLASPCWRKEGISGGGAVAVDARLTALPLSILDIGFPGLGLGGTASGSVHYAATADGAPTGRMDVTVRGLTRSGLVLTSRPIDVGVAAILEPGKNPELSQEGSKAEGEDPARPADTDGPNAIAVVLFIGAIGAVNAIFATRKLRYL